MANSRPTSTLLSSLLASHSLLSSFGHCHTHLTSSVDCSRTSWTSLSVPTLPAPTPRASRQRTILSSATALIASLQPGCSPGRTRYLTTTLQCIFRTYSSTGALSRFYPSSFTMYEWSATADQHKFAHALALLLSSLKLTNPLPR